MWKKSIYLLYYPKEKKLASFGLINGINQCKKISHYCNTEDGSSGSPILSLNNFKIIGVHYGGCNKNNIRLNYGTYIKYIITEFNKKYNNEIISILKIDNENKFEENNNIQINNKLMNNNNMGIKIIFNIDKQY